MEDRHVSDKDLVGAEKPHQKVLYYILNKKPIDKNIAYDALCDVIRSNEENKAEISSPSDVGGI